MCENSLYCIHVLRSLILSVLTTDFGFCEAAHSKAVLVIHILPIISHHLFQNEIHGLIEKYSVNDSLVEEIERLREENKRLRSNY